MENQDVIRIIQDEVGTAYYSDVWGELTPLAYCNYLQNIRNSGIVYRFSTPEKYGQIIQVKVFIRK